MTTTNDDYEDMVDYSLEDTHHDDMKESVRAGASPVSNILATLPSDTELQLTQRVIDLERERDALASRVKVLEARYPSHSSSIPATAAPSPISTEGETPPIPVPPELVPVLAILRQHIYELTRENAALRYTFLGSAAQADTNATSKVSDILTPGSSVATTPIPTDSPPIGIKVTPPVDPAPPRAGLGLTPIVAPVPTVSGPVPIDPPAAPASSSKDVDLCAVVERVKTLMLENEELGDMVAEAGKADGDEWVKTLEDTKAVIASLDSDLAHNLTVIEALRAEVDAYKARFGSLDAPSNGQTPTPQHRGGGGDRDRDRSDRDRGGDRSDRDRGDRGSERAPDRGDRSTPRTDRRRNGGGGGYQGDRPRDARDRDRDRDRERDARDNRDRQPRDDRDRDRRDERRDDRDRGDRSDRGGGRDKVPGSGGISILGRAEQGRRDEDRASKRRR